VDIVPKTFSTEPFQAKRFFSGFQRRSAVLFDFWFSLGSAGAGAGFLSGAAVPFQN
jgi:hypothetical protein